MQLAEVQVYNTVPADKSKLEALVEQYDALNRSLYTTDSLLSLEEVMEDVVAVMENDTLSIDDQAKVDAAATELQRALNELQYKPGMEPSEDQPSADDPPKEEENRGDEKPDSPNVGAIVGGVVGGALAVAIGTTVAVVLIKRKKK